MSFSVPQRRMTPCSSSPHVSPSALTLGEGRGSFLSVQINLTSKRSFQAPPELVRGEKTVQEQQITAYDSKQTLNHPTHLTHLPITHSQCLFQMFLS